MKILCVAAGVTFVQTAMGQSPVYAYLDSGIQFQVHSPLVLSINSATTGEICTVELITSQEKWDLAADYK